MTTYRKCDDCDTWTDREEMDRFERGYIIDVVCPTCSAKRRAKSD